MSMSPTTSGTSGWTVVSATGRRVASRRRTTAAGPSSSTTTPSDGTTSRPRRRRPTSVRARTRRRPTVRFEMMRNDFINAEIIYPTIGLYAWNVQDPEVGRQSCTVYNDWALERLGGIDRIRHRRNDPDLGSHHGDRRGAAHGGARLRRWPPRATGRHAGVELAGVGTALGRAPGTPASPWSCTRAPVTT